MKQTNIKLPDNLLLASIALFKLIFLIIFAGNYGIFRDEYYYLACTNHLAFGYVDQSPLSILILKLSTAVFGDSILAIRIFAYIASSITVFLSGIIAQELSGNRFAKIAAAIAVLFCGVVLGGGGYFSMNAFDILFSTYTFYLIIRLINTGDKNYWIYIGIMFGVGLQNKLSFLFFGVGLFIALLFTKHRSYFLSKEVWFGAGLAALIFLPNIIWQVINGFPTLEFMQNAAEYKNRAMGFGEFSIAAIMEMNPLNIIFLSVSFYFLIFNRTGKKYILIAIMFFVIYAVFVLNHGKPYYMGILYPVILTAGAVGIEWLFNKYLKPWYAYILLILLIPFYLLTVPFALPVLDIDTFINYSEKAGITHHNSENSDLGLLPQFFSDRFGWYEMAEKVAEVYNQLDAKEKTNTMIFGQNYGEAGAMEYYAEQFGFPAIISSHNNYALWGYPNYADSSTTWIVIGSNTEDNGEFFESVELAATHYNKYGMPFENVDIFICRKPKMSLSEIWDRIRFFI